MWRWRAQPRLQLVTALLLCLALGSIAFMIGRALFVIGMRNGDRLGDVRVGAAEPEGSGGGLSHHSTP
jgi:hypothetical protein